MIAYNPKTWFRHVFLFHKSDTLNVLKAEMAILAVYTTGITWLLLEYVDEIHLFKNTLVVHSLIGFIMGLLLVFRTNSSYDRWWEGRKLWGALVNHCRNISFKVNAFVPNRHEDIQVELKQLLSVFPYALKEHLRKGVNLQKVELSDHIKKEVSGFRHIPNGILAAIYKRLKICIDSKIISETEFLSIDNDLRALADVMGGCERIKNTPIPFSYSLFIKKFITIYVFTLPLGLIPDFQYWSIPIELFVFYVMVSLELLAEEIEDPFGSDDNDLPTDELSAKIHDNISEIIK
ncbi:MAG: bestrophin family protein [Bacteroidota bacterium]